MNALLEKAFAAVAKLPEAQQESIASRILAEVEACPPAASLPEDANPSFMERIKELQDEVKALSRPGGLPADKAFYDELSGDF